MGSMKRAEALRDAGVLAELALLLRSVRLMKNPTSDDTAQPALQRDPDEWKTGDEPMTDAQRSYLETLCRETGEEFDDALTKAEASKRIDELRARSPRLSDQWRGPVRWMQSAMSSVGLGRLRLEQHVAAVTNMGFHRRQLLHPWQVLGELEEWLVRPQTNRAGGSGHLR
jgi:hypothetical protein